MPYTLTSAATLGYDLVRLPGGRQAAGVVVSALRSGPAEWALLAAHHPLRTSDPSCDPLLAAQESARAREIASEGPRLQHLPPTDGGERSSERERLAALAEQLRCSMVGSAAAFERLVRTEALGCLDSPVDGSSDSTVDDDGALDRALAADVLADAALAAYAARELPRALRRRLSEPYERAVAGAVPGTFDLAPDPSTPWGPALSEVLSGLRGTDAEGRLRWRAAVDASRLAAQARLAPASTGDGVPGRSWSEAMHDACWAAHASGRTEAAAAAQMLAVQAFLDGGFGVDDGATGVWNAVAGCVQGVLVADLLGGGSLELLAQPWAAVTGRTLAGC
ncbi:hypothetical protein FHN55_03330 [Streptomyces sp. NP160]|uniref:hypothetical protein n=1 Tax=Streptomyces sp. NP160 TaxID=2586637 RepID=UPI0011184612|nr:hypothetical protein [Streptomyces sp. NP160]TNM69364.1 hypothetical protein FHN55_03330 [Streptomyces sp. NP160]